MRSVRIQVRPAIARRIRPVAPPEPRHPVREIRMQRARVARVQTRVSHRNRLPRARQPQHRPHVGNVHQVRPRGHIVPQPRLAIGLHPLHLAPARHRFQRRRRQNGPHQPPIRQLLHHRDESPRQFRNRPRHPHPVFRPEQQDIVLPRFLHPLGQHLPHRLRLLVGRQIFPHPRHVRHRPDLGHHRRRRFDQKGILRNVALEYRPRLHQRRLPLFLDHIAKLHQPRRPAPRIHLLRHLRQRRRPDRPRLRLLRRARRVHHTPVQHHRRPSRPQASGSQTAPRQKTDQGLFHSVLHRDTPSNY